jgi:hypothetical protein
MKSWPAIRSMLCLTGALFLAFLAGCDHDAYEVFLQPLESGFRRIVECRRIDRDEQQREVLKPMPQEVLDRLAAVYGGPAPLSAARRFPFTGEFAEATPPDVGGAGYCRRWRSSLGSLGVYAERFRGNDDQAAVLDRRLQAVDRLTELLAGWLHPQLGQTREWREFAAFLRGPFRQDLRNLALYAWAGSFAEDVGLVSPAGTAGEAAVARVLLFLAERNYLQPWDLPLWGQALREQDRATDSLAPLAPLIAGAVARRSGLPAESAVIVGLRRELERQEMLAALDAWLRTTPEWQALEVEAAKRRQGDPTAAAPLPREVLTSLALTAGGFDPGTGRTDELRLRLALAPKPLRTNGTWDAEKKEVSWETVLPGPEGTPYLAYAAWAEADEGAQTERFGRVVLQGDSLASYVLWVHGLAKEEAAEWEAFLGRLRPQGEPAARVAEFRFEAEMNAGPPTEESLAASRAQPARELLLKGLRE